MMAALHHYRAFLPDPSLLIGDLNMGPTLSLECFSHLSGLLVEMGLKDLSRIRTQQLSKDFHWKTFRMKRKEKFFYHHLDHAFGSPFFSDRLDSFEIDKQAMDKFSDHAPVVLDFSD